MKRRIFSSLLAAGLVAGVHVAALANAANSYPNKPIRIIVPYPAGGTADVLPRIVAPKLAEKWGQPVIIENRSGAGGNIGAEAAARAAADGYTLLATAPAPLCINQYLYKALPFDPQRFVPITVLATVPNVLAVRNALPAASARDLIAYAKRNTVTVATQGNGTTSHLTASMFSMQAGVQFTYVPYKGTAPALSDLLGGQIDAFFDNIGSMIRHHEAGRARILAVAGDKRSPLLPNVPTVAESGLPGFNSFTWFAVVAPPDTPPPIAHKISEAVADILRMRDVQQKFMDLGAEAVGNTPEQMARFVAGERLRWKKVIDEAGVTMN
jgi:tripartite-type tricarboxylate transporter receptor subunit TctC